MSDRYSNQQIVTLRQFIVTPYRYSVDHTGLSTTGIQTPSLTSSKYPSRRGADYDRAAVLIPGTGGCENQNGSQRGIRIADLIKKNSFLTPGF